MALSSGVRHMLREAALWVVVAGAGVGSFLYIDAMDWALPQLAALERTAPAEAPAARPSAVEIRADAYGHFVTPAAVNGRSVDVMVDTGASVVALTQDDAERIGIRVRPSDFTQRVATANGHAKVAPVQLDTVAVGDVVVRNVSAVVAERGRLETTLLGMTFLSRVGRVEMSAGRLILHE